MRCNKPTSGEPPGNVTHDQPPGQAVFLDARRQLSEVRHHLSAPRRAVATGHGKGLLIHLRAARAYAAAALATFGSGIFRLWPTTMRSLVKPLAALMACTVVRCARAIRARVSPVFTT